MPSKTRSPDADKTPREPPEILNRLGRAVLSYSLRKLGEQNASRRGDTSSRPRSSRSKSRDPSSKREGGSSRDMPRSDSGDMHALASQLAVGIVAFGIRHLIRRRREAKRQAAAAPAATTRGVSSSEGPRQENIDPELSAALDTVTKELHGASESIRRLAYSAPSSHRNCAVRDALAADAERLTGSLANMQASINNMKNLHPGLGQRTAQIGREGRRRWEAARAKRRVEETESSRRTSARRERGLGEAARPQEPPERHPRVRGAELRGRRRPEAVER